MPAFTYNNNSYTEMQLDLNFDINSLNLYVYQDII